MLRCILGAPVCLTFCHEGFSSILKVLTGKDPSFNHNGLAGLDHCLNPSLKG